MMTPLDMIANQFLNRTLQYASSVSPDDPAIGQLVQEFAMESVAGAGSVFRLTTEEGNEVLLFPEDEVLMID